MDDQLTTPAGVLHSYCAAGRRRLWPLACLLLTVLFACSLGSVSARAAAARTSQQLLADLDSAAAQTQQGDAQRGYPAFEQAIAQAYGVRDVQQLAGKVSVALIYPVAPDKPSPHVFLFPRAQSPQPAASCIKVALATRAALVAEQQPQPGWRLKLGKGTLASVTRKMIASSSNADANTLLHYFTAASMNSWLARLGFTPDELHFARDFGDFGHVARSADNTATAFGLAKFYCLLAQHSDLPGLGSAAALQAVTGLLDCQGDCNNHSAYNDRLNALVPRGVHFIHKTGSNADVMGDGGYFIVHGTQCVVVVLDETKNHRAQQQLGLGLYNQLAKAIPAAR